MKFSIHQASHIGNRKYNQDRAAYCYNNEAILLVLADGMGGHLNGEVAADMTITQFVSALSTQRPLQDPLSFLSDTMRAAHQDIMGLPHKKDKTFPGTTCVAAVIQEGKLYWGYAGDSRLYVFRRGRIFTRTLDHSMVQMWLECGVIDEEEARTHPRRHQITNCLGGVEDMFEIEVAAPIDLQSGDVIFLSSDGLHDPFLDKELAAAFAVSPVADALNKLLVRAVALEAGQADNATGVALRWGPDEPLHLTNDPVICVLEIK